MRIFCILITRWVEICLKLLSILLGIPKPDAEVHSDQLQGGNYLLMLDSTDNEISRAEGVLSSQGLQDWAVYPAASAEHNNAFRAGSPRPHEGVTGDC